MQCLYIICKLYVFIVNISMLFFFFTYEHKNYLKSLDVKTPNFDSFGWWVYLINEQVKFDFIFSVHLKNEM